MSRRVYVSHRYGVVKNERAGRYYTTRVQRARTMHALVAHLLNTRDYRHASIVLSQWLLSSDTNNNSSTSSSPSSDFVSLDVARNMTSLARQAPRYFKRVWQRAAADDPKRVRLALELVVAYMQRREYQSAYDMLFPLLAVEPYKGDGNCHAYAGLCSYYLRAYKKAKVHFESAFDITDDDDVSCVWRHAYLLCMLQIGEEKNAKHVLDLSLSSSSVDSVVWGVQARAALSNDDIDNLDNIDLNALASSFIIKYPIS